MKITFVIGPPSVGKSTYIKKKYPERTVIDLYDFQTDFMTLEQVWQSYFDCRDALVAAIKEDKDVVLEHTLLKAVRREIYIDAVKEVTNCPIDIVLIKPDIDIIRERWKQREIYRNDYEIIECLEVLEEPTKSEGFENIIIITE